MRGSQDPRSFPRGTCGCAFRHCFFRPCLSPVAACAEKPRVKSILKNIIKSYGPARRQSVRSANVEKTLGSSHDTAQTYGLAGRRTGPGRGLPPLHLQAGRGRRPFRQRGQYLGRGAHRGAGAPGTGGCLCRASAPGAAAPGPAHPAGNHGAAPRGRRDGVRHRGQPRPCRPQRAGQPRCGHLRGLPARHAHARRSALRLCLHQLHQLRAALHHHPVHPLRPRHHQHALSIKYHQYTSLTYNFFIDLILSQNIYFTIQKTS